MEAASAALEPTSSELAAARTQLTANLRAERRRDRFGLQPEATEDECAAAAAVAAAAAAAATPSSSDAGGGDHGGDLLPDLEAVDDWAGDESEEELSLDSILQEEGLRMEYCSPLICDEPEEDFTARLPPSPRGSPRYHHGMVGSAHGAHAAGLVGDQAAVKPLHKAAMRKGFGQKQQYGRRAQRLTTARSPDGGISALPDGGGPPYGSAAKVSGEVQGMHVATDFPSEDSEGGEEEEVVAVEDQVEGAEGSDDDDDDDDDGGWRTFVSKEPLAVERTGGALLDRALAQLRAATTTTTTTTTTWSTPPGKRVQPSQRVEVEVEAAPPAGSRAGSGQSGLARKAVSGLTPRRKRLLTSKLQMFEDYLAGRGPQSTAHCGVPSEYPPSDTVAAAHCGRGGFSSAPSAPCAAAGYAASEEVLSISVSVYSLGKNEKLKLWNTRWVVYQCRILPSSRPNGEQQSRRPSSRAPRLQSSYRLR